MPPRIPDETVSAVLNLHAEIGNIAEVARRLGLRHTTVQAIFNRERAKCARCGGPVRRPAAHCETCRPIVAAAVRVKQRARKLEGLCAVCEAPIARPSSTVYCAIHRDLAREAKMRHKAKARMVHGGLPSEERRLKGLRENYGEAGVAVWKRDDGRCRMCGVTHAERSVHIHHIDGNHGNSVEENMACLCQRCHRLAHLLSEHPALSYAMPFLVAHYPALAAYLRWT